MRRCDLLRDRARRAATRKMFADRRAREISHGSIGKLCAPRQTKQPGSILLNREVTGSEPIMRAGSMSDMSGSLPIQFPGTRGSSQATIFYHVISGFMIQGGGFVLHANIPVEPLVIDARRIRH